MTNEQKSVREWMKKFGQECPEKPTIPSLEVRKLRAKLILEEALETINALGIGVYVQDENGEWDRIQDFDINSLEFNDDWIEEAPENPLIEIADGCEDLKVVTEGTLIACGLVQKNKPKVVGAHYYHEIISDPLFDEVMRSNNSKFWNDEEDMHNPELTYIKIAEHPEVDISYYAAKDKDGKIIKSPSYSPPNLQPIIDEMSK